MNLSHNFQQKRTHNRFIVTPKHTSSSQGKAFKRHGCSQIFDLQISPDFRHYLKNIIINNYSTLNPQDTHCRIQFHLSPFRDVTVFYLPNCRTMDTSHVGTFFRGHQGLLCNVVSFSSRTTTQEHTLGALCWISQSKFIHVIVFEKVPSVNPTNS